jgi:acyl-CoA thioesterase I
MVLRVAACLVLMLSASCAYSATKSILVLGDSLSAEYGLSRGAGWISLLQNRLETEKIDAKIINASISGETTSGGRSRLPSLLKNHRPTHVLIELGANDGLRGLSLTATESNLQNIVNSAKESGAHVLLIGMQLPPNYGADYSKRFAAMFPRLAKSNRVGLVPFLLDGIATDPDMFQADRIHPTAQAQPVLLDSVWPHLKPLLLKTR